MNRQAPGCKKPKLLKSCCYQDFGHQSTQAVDMSVITLSGSIRFDSSLVKASHANCPLHNTIKHKLFHNICHSGEI